MIQSFGPVKQKPLKYSVCGFDTEDDTKGFVTLFSFYSDKGGKVFKTHEQAINYIYSFTEKTIFVAHNLLYDFVNFFRDGNFIHVNDGVLSGTRLLKFTLEGCPHVFIDSSAFFPGTLKKLGKLMGIEKLEGHSTNEEYAIRDAEIPYRFIKRFQDHLIDVEKINMGITVGQLSMNIYRSQYMTSKKQVTYNSENCIKSYYGGRTEVFYRGNIENVYVSDIQSSYPDAMANNNYPDPQSMEPNTSIDTHEYGIGEFEIFVPDSLYIPVLPYKDPESGRLFFPKGLIRGWWTYPEVRYAVSQGCIIKKEYQGEGTNTGVKPFVNFVEDIYSKREKYKGILENFPDNDEARFYNHFYKLVLNNLYGKWMQHNPNGKVTKRKIPLKELQKHMHHPDFVMKPLGGLYWYVLPTEKPSPTANYIWGTYVTSYARIKLHQGMQKITSLGYIPLYCDTDSIMYSAPKGIESPLPISKQLGNWDMEFFDMGAFTASKCYVLFNREDDFYNPVKIAAKGVPQSHAFDFVTKGFTGKYSKPIPLKQSLTRLEADSNKDESSEFLKELQANYWRDEEKELRALYIKRLTKNGEFGPTYPVDTKDIPKLIRNATSDEPLSLKDVLRDFKIKSPQKASPWVVPEFDRKTWGKEEPLPIINESQYDIKKAAKLFPSDCENINPNEYWFEGTPFKIAIRGRQTYVFIILTKYLNKILAAPFCGRVSLKVMESLFIESKNFLNKKVAVSLKETYVDSTFPKLIGTTSEASLTIPDIDDEEPDELTEEEKAKLMGMDFGELKWKMASNTQAESQPQP